MPALAEVQNSCGFFFFLILYIHTSRNLYTGRYFPKRAGMAETDRNGPDFNLRWNRRVFRTGSLLDTKFSGRFGRNGTDSSTIVFSPPFM
jgi:hypothetical protein